MIIAYNAIDKTEKYIDSKYLNVDILYEDNHILIVIKPENVGTQKDISGDICMEDILKEYLRVKYNKPGEAYLGIVHRLDRPVSGVMVFAKTSKAASRISKTIFKNRMKKRYLAAVKGRLKELQIGDIKKIQDKLYKVGRLNKSFVLKRDDQKNKKRAKKAELEFKYLAYNKVENISLVDINLITGRHHQIRVQFENYGHPVFADSKYDKKYTSDIHLFSYYLEFEHPVRKDENNKPRIIKCLAYPNYDKYKNFKIFEYEINSLIRNHL